jgi:hypothetical protein
MKRIKKFESFSHRMPEKVTYDEWLKKYKRFGACPFTKGEIDFFRKLKEMNSDIVDNVKVETKPHCEVEESEIHIQFFNMEEDDDDIIEIQLNKLEDDWYLIYKFYNHDFEEFFICDEWEEVLGYLCTKTKLIL